MSPVLVRSGVDKCNGKTKNSLRGVAINDKGSLYYSFKVEWSEHMRIIR